jgi:hypothetical protein
VAFHAGQIKVRETVFSLKKLACDLPQPILKAKNYS